MATQVPGPSGDLTLLVVYSKKSGVRTFLFELGQAASLSDACSCVESQYREHKDFAYALVDGVEIKLFS